MIVCACLCVAACDSIYYKTMKRFGMEKRDILVKRVRDAQKSQTEAKEEFQSALEAAIKEADTFIKDMDAEAAAENPLSCAFRSTALAA